MLFIGLVILTRVWIEAGKARQMFSAGAGGISWVGEEGGWVGCQVQVSSNSKRSRVEFDGLDTSHTLSSDGIFDGIQTLLVCPNLGITSFLAIYVALAVAPSNFFIRLFCI